MHNLWYYELIKTNENTISSGRYWFWPTAGTSFKAAAAHCEQHNSKEEPQEMSQAINWIVCQKDLISHHSCGKVITVHGGCYICFQWSQTISTVINYNMIRNLLLHVIGELIWISFIFHGALMFIKQRSYYFTVMRSKQTVTSLSLLCFIFVAHWLRLWSLTFSHLSVQKWLSKTPRCSDTHINSCCFKSH